MRFYRKHIVTLLLGRIELDVMELDTSTELYVTGSASTGGERRRLEQRRQNRSCDHEQRRTTQSGANDAGEWMRMSHEVRTGTDA
jgi:hypothetical protein